jgi:hypothetical protein
MKPRSKPPSAVPDQYAGFLGGSDEGSSRLLHAPRPFHRIEAGTPRSGKFLAAVDWPILTKDFGGLSDGTHVPQLTRLINFNRDSKKIEVGHGGSTHTNGTLFRKAKFD